VKTNAEYFLEYFNNFLTVDRFAEYYGMTKDKAQKVIDSGRIQHQKNVEKEYKKAKRKTLATSGSSEALKKVITEYFYGTEYALKANGLIESVKTGEKLQGFEWSMKRGRYQFLQVLP
jgi:hypothetical protein